MEGGSSRGGLLWHQRSAGSPAEWQAGLSALHIAPRHSGVRNPQALQQAQIFKATGRRCQSVSDSRKRKDALKDVYRGSPKVALFLTVLKTQSNQKGGAYSD